MALPVKIYEPNNNHQGFFSIIKEMFIELIASFGLGKRLFLRDKKAEYRQSIFGVLWALITPLTNAIVWIFLSASGAVNVSNSDIPYPLFVFIGTMLWGIFSDSLNITLLQTNQSKALISKINFPKEAILVSGFYKVLFNSSIKVAIIVVALFIFPVHPNIEILYFFPLLLLLILFGLAFGLLLTPIGMLYTDIGRAIPIVLSFLMYLTPVVYKEAKVGFLSKIIHLNPLTPIINSIRNVLTGFPIDNPMYLLGITVVSVVIFFIGWLFYRVSIPIIVERM